MMTAGSILLGIALLAAVALYLSYPFWGGSSQHRQERKTQHELLLERKEALLDQIRSLDFDHETGKIPGELHQKQRATLMAAAAETMQQLDALAGGGAAAGVDAAIEAAIAQARGQHQPDAVPATVDEDIEAAIAQVRSKRPSATTGRAQFCTQCGSRIDAADKFCAACGHKLVPVPAVK